MFDESQFMTAAWKQRTTDVPVPDLKGFFGKDKPVWKVRGLTGPEAATINNAIAKNQNLMALATALKGDQTEKVENLRELLGVQDGDTPDDFIRKKEALVLGSVSPKCSEELAVKLAQVHPTIFFQLTQEVMRLTGLGQDPGKLKPSGKTKK